MLPGGGPEYSGASIVYYLWQKGMNNFQMGYASAMAWILALITFVVTFIQFRLRKSDTEI
jgi:multiple sugar transport system permease protein